MLIGGYFLKQYSRSKAKAESNNTNHKITINHLNYTYLINTL